MKSEEFKSKNNIFDKIKDSIYRMKLKKEERKNIYKRDFRIKVNKKKVIIFSFIAIILIISIIIYLIYCNNLEFRSYVDTNILGKEIIQNDAVTLEVQDLDVDNVIAYNSKIGILNKNVFQIYNSSAVKESELEIKITNNIYSSQNRFLAIAEEGGSKIYLIENNTIKWEDTVEGNISSVYVNKNGYVAVLITGTTHKSIIQMYDLDGEELFKSYLASTTAIDVSISSDNKYLAFAEIDTSRKRNKIYN